MPGLVMGGVGMQEWRVGDAILGKILIARLASSGLGRTSRHQESAVAVCSLSLGVTHSHPQQQQHHHVHLYIEELAVVLLAGLRGKVLASGSLPTQPIVVITQTTARSTLALAFSLTHLHTTQAPKRPYIKRNDRATSTGADGPSGHAAPGEK